MDNTAMENQFIERISYCREMMDRYADKPGRSNNEQWSMWCGQLHAWQDAYAAYLSFHPRFSWEKVE